jgi:peptidoglycan/xylan/chitin deacetylase (PgdA/CDA1 family)
MTFGDPVYLHRVLPNDQPAPRFGPDQEHAIRAPDFDAFLAEWGETLRRADAAGEPLITLDDGYRDVLETVLPRLEAAGVRASVFVVTGFAEGEVTPVEYRVAALLAACSDVVTPDGARYSLTDDAQRHRAYEQLWRPMKKRRPQERESALARLAEANGVDARDLRGPSMLSRAEVQDLARHPCIDIGAHGAGHGFLPMLGWRDLVSEILVATRRIAGWIDQPVCRFAYPYGGGGR